MIPNTDISNRKIHIYFFISYRFPYDIKTPPLAPGHPPPLKVGARPRLETVETEKAIFQFLAWHLTWNSCQWIWLGDHAETPTHAI